MSGDTWFTITKMGFHQRRKSQTPGFGGLLAGWSRNSDAHLKWWQLCPAGEEADTATRTKNQHLIPKNECVILQTQKQELEAAILP